MTVEDTEQVAAHEREIEEQNLRDGEHYDALRTTAMDIAGGLMEEGVCAEAQNETFEEESTTEVCGNEGGEPRYDDH